MNGRGFVVLLAGAALVAAGAIVLGTPRREPERPAAGRDGAAPIGDPSPAPDSSAALASAIDPSVTTSSDTAAAWDYRRTAVEDLDGDGVPERLVLASDVFVTEDGEPVWEDVQRWAVYVEEDDGERTLVYAGHAAPGAVAVAAAARSAIDRGAVAGRRPIVIVEQDTHRARLLLAAYDGPGRRRLVDVVGMQLDAWVDRVAEETR
jgi:hypothetical protein